MSTSDVVILFYWIVFVCSFSHISELKADECLHTDQTCADLVIPYPFGIEGKGNNCGLPGFEINCKQNQSFGTTQPIPFLPIPSGEVQILNISNDHLLINATHFYASNCESTRNVTSFTVPNEGPFRISGFNKFVAVGCRALGLFGMAHENSDPLLGGCLSVCSHNPILSDCNGDGCCITSVPSNYTQYGVAASNLTLKMDYNYDVTPCSYAAILDVNSWDLVSKSGTPNFSRDAFLRLDWAIPNNTCISAKARSSYQCALNADCEDRDWGYACKCESGYKGDGYFNGTGCTDIDECADPYLNDCYPSSQGGRCVNTKGSYKCSCAKGRGDGTRNGTRCTSTSFPALPVTIGVCVTLLAVVVGGGVLFWIHKRRSSWVAKRNNFRRNGGPHLQRLMSSRREATRIFTLDEIEKATNNFSPNLVLGSGGYGMVYKATLSDATVVAIKKSKSKEVDPADIDQFINECVILSQINHRNVVKLIGCCLETPVPLLVYEYISNGTLSEHLYDDKYDEQHLQWEERLRIAIDTAEALSYLHSAASVPIVHRDVKSSNILLDENYIPKVADFGVSRLVPMDQTHITTVVQGTLGYLDPEYFQTIQLTEKSDVYSFGVVLVELLTGLNPVSYERMKRQGNLAMYFLSTMKMDGLMEILDSELNVESTGNTESMVRVANLAKECLSVEGQKRPAMKEVVQELLWIRRGRRLHPRLDTRVENEEEMVSLMVDEAERSNEVQPGIEMLDLYTESAPRQSSVLFSFQDKLDTGR